MRRRRFARRLPARHGARASPGHEPQHAQAAQHQRVAARLGHGGGAEVGVVGREVRDGREAIEAAVARPQVPGLVALREAGGRQQRTATHGRDRIAVDRDRAARRGRAGRGRCCRCRWGAAARRGRTARLWVYRVAGGCHALGPSRRRTGVRPEGHRLEHGVPRDRGARRLRRGDWQPAVRAHGAAQGDQAVLGEAVCGRGRSSRPVLLLF